MITGKLAQLWIDIGVRGNAKVYLDSLKEQVDAMDKSLANSGKLYAAQSAGKMVQMAKIAVRQKQLAEMDMKTYGSTKFQKVAELREETETAQHLADLVKQKVILEAKQKQLQSPAGQDIANKNAQNERLVKQNREIANYRQMVAENGRISAALMRVRDRLSTLTTASTIAFGSMTAGISGAVASLDSDVFRTFAGSIRVLSGEIGLIFMPLIIDVSRLIQKAANWIRDLSPEVKGQVLYWAKWGLAITGALMVLPRVISAITAAISVFRTLSSVVSAMGPGMMAAFGNPVVVGILAAVAAVLALAWAMDKLSNANRNAIEASRSRRDRLEGGGRMTDEDFESLPAALRQRILNASPEDRGRIIDEQIAENNRRIQQNRPGEQGAQQNLANLQNRPDMQIANSTRGYEAPSLLQFGILGIFQTALKFYRDREEDKTRAPVATAESLREQNATLRAAKSQGIPGSPGFGSGGPMDRSSNHVAQFTSFDEGWRRIQQQAASGGGLEDRMYQQQTRANEYLKAIATNTTPGNGAAGGTKP